MDAAILTHMVFSVLGGLGLFLLGMKNMSDGMQAIAGSGLRRMIGAVTDNRFLAVGVGTLVTCVVQSSSITSVMVVGFVNSGVMELSQAVGVIIGANIGTTITGWILVLKIGKYGLPLLGGAAFVYLFARGDRWRYMAMTLMGVGMVFFGLELMKDACAQIKQLPEFEAWFQRFQADSYLGVLRCALAGCLLTIMVQSSSATLGITISLAFEGVISYPTAAALVLGENIGTTITAYLASLGATTNARRAAYFHVIFNLAGVFWITLIFQWYIELVQWLVDGNVAEAVVVNGQTTFPNTTPAIAVTHSLFNIANTLLFLALIPKMVRMLEHLVPSRTYKEKPHLTDLDIRILESPLLAIEQSRKEILKMGEGCRKMMTWLLTLRTQEQHDLQLVERLQRREQVLDSIQDEVVVFITDLLANNIPHQVAEEAREQLRVAHEYEAISDYIETLMKSDRRLRKAGLRFTESQEEGLTRLHDLVADYLREVDDANRQQNRSILTTLEPKRKLIRAEIKQLRQKHLEDLSSASLPPQVSVAFMVCLNAYARVRDHSQNIAEALEEVA